MQQEKKGLFGRLLDFWKEKTEEADGGIGFWSGGKMEGKTAAENRQDALSQEKAEKKPFFWEETVRTAKEKKAEEAETFGQEWRRPFAEQEKRKTIPIVAETGLAEKAAAAEEAEELPQEAPKKEREQAKGAEIDLERLMREMTKRLWEEREASGRRLRR